MIPSAVWRRTVVGLAILALAGVALSLAWQIAPQPPASEAAQSVAGVAFLLIFYAGAPLYARFLAARRSDNLLLLERLRAACESVPCVCPLFLYEHRDKNANTVGIIPAHATVYITTALVEYLSEAGLCGILAHEQTHVRERHILVTAAYACAYCLATQLTGSGALFVLGFLVFLALRRRLEFRADAGGARLAGRAAITAGLAELERVSPGRRWHRWIAFLSPYPTLTMRLRALETGRPPIF